MFKKKENKNNGSGFRISVTTKIAIALCLLLSFLMVTVGASVFFKSHEQIKKDYELKGWSIIHTALQFSGNYIQIGNRDFLNNLVATIGQYQDVSYAMVLDAGGRVIAHSDEKQVGSTLNEEITKSILAAKYDVMKIHNNDRGKPALMDFYSPINTAGGSTIGYFRLGLDLTSLNKFVYDTAQNIIIIIIMALICGILMAASITRRILHKPLKDLTAATERVATGDFSSKVPTHSQDELGDLAAAFNTMTINLANLIQSVKSSALDINKSAEQILGRLKNSDQANVRLTETFELMKQSNEEHLQVLKKSIALSEQLSDQSRKAVESIMQIFHEVNSTSRIGETGASAISKIAEDVEGAAYSLENTRSNLKELESKGRQFGETINQFSKLLEKNTAVVVQVALEAARSGNDKLARTVEELQIISEDSTHRIKEMYADLSIMHNSWSDADVALHGNIQRLADGQESVREAGRTLEKVLHSLIQSKASIEEAATTAQKQCSSIEDLLENQSGIIESLLRSINKSSAAGSDTKLQTQNLHDIDSLAKKLMRMVDRLNGLSVQFKV